MDRQILLQNSLACNAMGHKTAFERLKIKLEIFSLSITDLYPTVKGSQVFCDTYKSYHSCILVPVLRYIIQYSHSVISIVLQSFKNK